MVVFTDFEGWRIRLTDERWRHIEEHPEMVGFRDAVGETLRDPEVVVESASDAQARLYYRFYSRTIIGASANDAFVVTAYLTDRVKKGKILWPEEL